MFIELTQNEKTTIHNKFKNSGFEITEIDLTTAEFSVSDNNKSTSCMVELPDKTKGYNDYSAIMLWTNDESGYSSFPVPLSYNSVMGEGETAELIDIRITLQDVEPGKIKITFSVYDDNYDYTFFDDMIFSLESLALFSAPYLNVSAENTIIAGNVGNLFDTYSASDKDILSLESILKEKRNILTCDYDEETANDLIKYYTVSWREPTGTSTEPVFDGTNYYAPASKVNLTYVPFIKIDGLIGYTSDAYDSLDEQTKLNASTVNTQKLNEEISKLSTKLRYIFLEKDLIYPVGNTVKDNGNNGIANVSKCIELGSNVTLVGNNATLCAVTGSNVVSVIFGSNKIVRNPNMTYGNTHFYNLNVIGRYTDTDKPADQAIHCYNIQKNESFSILPQNVNFGNCKFTNFCYGVHINNNKYYDMPLYWTFDNCDFKTGMGFNLTGVKNLKLLNSHIDNCLSSGKGDHCIYVSEKCSYITVDRCLLENSAGGAIHQRYDNEATVPTDGFNLNNVYKSIIIHSCLTGLDIGLSSKNTVIENVTMVDITRGIKLHSCENVTIKNVYATGAFCQNTKSFASGDERTYNFYKNEEGKWCVGDYYAVSIIGTARAHIIDCYFSFASPLIFAGGYNTKSKEIGNLFINYGSLFKDGLSESNIIFDNCIFESSSNFFSSNEPLNSVNLGNTKNYSFVVDGKQVTLRQKHNINFKKCQLRFDFETIVKSLAYLKGNVNFPSNYVFDSCKVMLFIQNIAAQNKISLTGAYFASAAQGSNVTIKDTVFYNNCKTHKIEKINEEIHEYDSPYFKLLSDDAVGTLSNNSSKEYIKLS